MKCPSIPQACRTQSTPHFLGLYSFTSNFAQTICRLFGSSLPFHLAINRQSTSLFILARKENVNKQRFILHHSFPNFQIFVKSFSGATVDCMNSHVCPTIKWDPGRIILHCGTNDLRSKATPKEIAEEITDLGNSMKTNENKVIISGLVPRGDQWHNKAMEVNKFLKQLCVSQDFYFIDNTNIQAEHHLNRSRIHLNREGTRILANNSLYALGY